jgi:YfiH family protein
VLRLIKSGIAAPAGGVFTTRAGGTSSAPWDSLNLAVHVGDAHAKVQHNRGLLTERLGLTGLAFAKQVHGAGVRVVSSLSKRTSRGLDDTDALITTVPGIGLVVMGADCLPVLLSSSDGTPVVGVAHVGRGGLVAGVLPEVVRVMREQGAGQLHAVIGPGICGECYEVPGSMAGEVEKAAPGSRCTTRAGTTGIDLTRGAAAQLAAEGVPWTAVGGCTVEQPDQLFSYRRDGVTGRQAGVVWLT